MKSDVFKTAQHDRAALAALLEGEQQVIGAVAEAVRRDPRLVAGGIAVQCTDVRPFAVRLNDAARQRMKLLDPHGGGPVIFQAGAQHHGGIPRTMHLKV